MRFLLGLIVGACAFVAAEQVLLREPTPTPSFEHALRGIAAAFEVSGADEATTAAASGAGAIADEPDEAPVGPTRRATARSSTAAASPAAPAAGVPMPAHEPAAGRASASRPTAPPAVDARPSDGEASAGTASGMGAVAPPTAGTERRSQPVAAPTPGAPRTDAAGGAESVWVPFRSEISARGFAGRLTDALAHPFGVREAPAGHYQVFFHFDDEAQRRRLLVRIAAVTGADAAAPGGDLKGDRR